MAKPGSGALVYNSGRKLITANWKHDPTPNAVFFDDFLGDTLHADLWTTAADTGCTAAAISLGAGGLAKMLTDTTDDDRVDMGTAVMWQPSAGAIYAEARIKATTVTTIGINFGLIDAATQASQVLAFALSGTTWTTTPVDGVVWAFDTDATTDVFNGIGVKANTDTAAVAGAVIVANTWMKLGIHVSTGGHATFFQDDARIGSVQNATTATTLHSAYLGLINRTGAAHDLFVDYVYVGQDLAR